MFILTSVITTTLFFKLCQNKQHRQDCHTFDVTMQKRQNVILSSWYDIKQFLLDPASYHQQTNYGFELIQDVE